MRRAISIAFGVHLKIMVMESDSEVSAKNSYSPGEVYGTSPISLAKAVNFALVPPIPVNCNTNEAFCVSVQTSQKGRFFTSLKNTVAERKCYI